MIVEESMEDKDPVIHYTDINYYKQSPCGNKNPNSYVTTEYEEVSCPNCLKALKSKMN